LTLPEWHPHHPRRKWEGYPILVILSILIPPFGLLLGFIGICITKRGSIWLMLIGLAAVILHLRIWVAITGF